MRWRTRVMAVCAIVVTMTLPLNALAAKNATAPEEPTSIPAPTVLSPIDEESFTTPTPTFTGVTKNKTRVSVFLDGRFHGSAKVRNHESGTASWVYTPEKSLRPGRHVIEALAESATALLLSPQSEGIAFTIAHPLPAPTLLEPVVNEETTNTKPFIIGVAPSKTLLEIFIDSELNGLVRVADHESGVNAFRYQPFLSLNPKIKHTVSVRATDEHGKRSAMSELLTFSVTADAPAVIETSEATPSEETEEAVSESVTEESEPAEETVTPDEETLVPPLEEVITPAPDEEEAPVEETEEEEQATESVEGNVLGEATTSGISEEEEAAKNDGNEDRVNANANASVAAESEDEDEDSDSAATTTTDDASKNSTVGWIILALIVIALIWRGRKSLFGGDDSGKNSNLSTPTPSSSSPKGQMSFGSKNEHESSASFEAKEPGKNEPPSPPPVSTY